MALQAVRGLGGQGVDHLGLLSAQDPSQILAPSQLLANGGEREGTFIQFPILTTTLKSK